ncbi:MAG: DNA cytosine methyltransferase, partial [Bacteroidota bacterium]
MTNLVGRVDVVLAGPPCQGHSNLNNRSRRDDRRNELYLTVPAVAIALRASVVVIENVPAVVHDWSEVVPAARRLFETNGYSVIDGTISADDLGWPQTRRRHFMVARKDAAPVPLQAIERALSDESRSLWWAIGHLEDVVSSDSPMTQETELTSVNQKRIDWLFENDAYDLDLGERPESHRGGTTYTSVYGRMRADAPAPTITTGFMTPGRGRYVHPTRRRVLTAQEAARLQGFPDAYAFVTDSGDVPSRSKLAKWIGDAVPMPLGYAA